MESLSDLKRRRDRVIDWIRKSQSTDHWSPAGAGFDIKQERTLFAELRATNEKIKEMEAAK